MNRSNHFTFFCLLQVSTSVFLILSKSASIGRAKSSVAGEFHYQHDALPLIIMIDKQSEQGNDVRDITRPAPKLLLKSVTRRYIVPWRIEFSCEIKRKCSGCRKTDKASTVFCTTASAICSLSSDKLFRQQSFTFRISVLLSWNRASVRADLTLCKYANYIKLLNLAK